MDNWIKEEKKEKKLSPFVLFLLLVTLLLAVNEWMHRAITAIATALYRSWSHNSNTNGISTSTTVPRSCCCVHRDVTRDWQQVVQFSQWGAASFFTTITTTFTLQFSFSRSDSFIYYIRFSISRIYCNSLIYCCKILRMKTITWNCIEHLIGSV